jgi:hypothetical protein
MKIFCSKFKKTALVLSVFCLAASGRADQPVQVGGAEPIAMKKAGKHSKTSFVMQKLSQQYAAHLVATRGKAPRPFKSPSSLLPVSNDELVIDAIAVTDPQGLLKSLQLLGLKQGAVAGHVVSGRLPVRSISKLQTLKGLRFARPAFASTRVTLGTAVSQGDKAMLADVARAKYGLSGSGIRVGILSDSFNTAYATDQIAPSQAAGELPLDVQILSDTGGGADEGRAMAEIVHDVAPGASIAFYTAFNGEADFANGIRALKDFGCQVIVDDVGYYDEPMFADGVIAQAVDEVRDAGVAYFSAAGNDSKNALVENGGFMPCAEEPAFHQFSSNPNSNPFLLPVTVGPGWNIFVLQWAQPYASASPKGAYSDLDLQVWATQATFNTIQAGGGIYGGYDNNLTFDPTEVVEIDNPTASSLTVYLAINLYDGPAPTLMKMIWNAQSSITVHPDPTSTAVRPGALYGHPIAIGACAVGAVRYDSTPAFHLQPFQLEYFSSAGPAPIFFNANGDWAPELRLKPEFTAPDGGDTSFFYPGSDYEKDGWPNFFGTSAAAPHAAALAALMLNAVKISPDTVKSILETTAIDMETTGFDWDTGYGFVQADEALDALFARYDLSGDTKIDALDITTLMGAIRSKSTHLKYDLNGDGKVDIADARWLALHLSK